MSLAIQFYLLIHMVLYGAFVGITFDCITTLKDDLKNKYLKIAVMILYWIAQIPLVYIYTYNVNDGIFHFYIIIFLIIGALSYFKFMKKRFHQELELLGENIYIIMRIFKKLLNILVISPIRFIYKIISDIMKGILKILKLIFYTPFVRLGKWRLNKKKVKQSVKKANGNKAE